MTGSNTLGGRVYQQSRTLVRIMLDVPVEGIDSGHWRLDVGCNDFALEAQLKALRALHLDPVAQDRQDLTSIGGPNAPVESTQNRVETVLHGTTLRDTLLRAFQGDYVAPGSREITGIGDTLHDSLSSQPDDLDADVSALTKASSSGLLMQNQLIQSWTKRMLRNDGVAPIRLDGDPILDMNESQKRAIALMLSEKISLVQGPPGTVSPAVTILGSG